MQEHTSKKAIRKFGNDIRPLAGFFLLVLLFTSFMFRDILFNVRPLMNGDSVVLREELIPFYDFNTQFLDQLTFGKSPLTQTDEIRISYSFWTSWMRYWNILPFSIIVLNAVSWFIFFLSTYVVMKRLLRGRPRPELLWLSFLPSSFIFMLMLYSKITHFYTLIFGFSLFALACSLTLVSIFLEKGRTRPLNLAISLLVLLNPAIHYHVLYYFLLAMLLPLAYFYGRTKSDQAMRRYAELAVMNLFVSLIPYAAFILYVMHGSSADVSTTIPVTYSSIFFSSNYVMHLASFDISAQADMFFHGNYLVDVPRYSKMLFFILLLAPLIYSRIDMFKKNRLFITMCYIILTVSLWMSIGYTHVLTFHSLGADLMNVLYGIDSWGLSILKEVAGAAIQILRFPHRFEFIMFYIAPVIAAFSLAILRQQLGRRSFIAVVLLSLIGPLVADADYRGMIFSGDMNGFMKPYAIPDDLKNIKGIVNADPGLGIILPTMESGRETDSDGTKYGFIDKFFIYYLDNPFLYYGTASELENKVRSFLVYQSVLYDQGWWDQVLKNAMHVRYILVPHATSRLLGNTYLPDIDPNLLDKIRKSGIYKPVYEGQFFSLYSSDIAESGTGSVLMDTPVKHYAAQFATSLLKNAKDIRFLYDAKAFLSATGSKYLVTDNPEQAYYDLVSSVSGNSAARYFPDTEILPFSSSFISSTFYTNTPLSQKTLLLPDENYNLTDRSVPDLINAESLQFMAVTGSRDKIRFKFKGDGSQKMLLLKVIHDKDALEATVNGRSVIFRRIDGPYNTFSYFYSTFDARSGDNVLEVGNDPAETAEHADMLVAESLLVLDPKLRFQDGEDGEGGDGLLMHPYAEGQYSLEVTKL